MCSIIKEFFIFNDFPLNEPQFIKCFYINEFNFNRKFGYCVTIDNNVYGLGERVHYYLGYEEVTSNIKYVLIEELSGLNIEEFYKGPNCMFARNVENQIISWGLNDNGQLGKSQIGDVDHYFKPNIVDVFDGKNIINIICGDSHCLALSSNGVLYGWGNNSVGQIGYGEEEKIVLIPKEIDIRDKIKAIHCSGDISLAVSYPGIAYFFGKFQWNVYYYPVSPLLSKTIKIKSILNGFEFFVSDYKEISYKLEGYFNKYCDLNKMKEWFQIKDAGQVIDIFTNKDEILIQTDKWVYVDRYLKIEMGNYIAHYGFNDFENARNSRNINSLTLRGALTCDDHLLTSFDRYFEENSEIHKTYDKTLFEYFLFEKQITPKTIQINNNELYEIKFEKNDYSTSLIKKQKLIYIQDSKNSNQNKLELSLRKFRISNDLPQILKSNVEFYYQSGNNSFDYFALFVMKDNRVCCEGHNNKGQLGIGLKDHNYVYKYIPELFDKNIQDFYEGCDCMFARSIENQIYSWGSNLFGQLGRGFQSEQEYTFKPEKIDFFDDKNIIHISCGSNYCFALSKDGSVYGWGGMERGDKICTPTKIPLTEKIKFIHKSLVITFNGDIYYCSDIYSHKLVNIQNAIKCGQYKLYDKYIILDESGNVYYFEAMDDRLINIYVDVEFIDLYSDENYCLLQSEEWVYQVEEKNGVFKLEKTDFTNFYFYFSHKKQYMRKTFAIREGNLILKDIQFDKMQNVINFKDIFVFESKFLGLFEDCKEIGQGSFGQVFKVKKLANNLIYAIKMMISSNDKELKEIEMLSKLNHNFVVQYIDSWIENKIILKKPKRLLFIQMEYCSHNLTDLIKLQTKTYDDNFKIFNYYISVEIFKELIECINYLHSIQIIHRDLKPGNVLISNGINGRFLKLCDFGSASFHENSVHTRMVGTEKYMAPEVRNSEHYNLKSDIYSLAIIACELFQLKGSVKNSPKLRHKYDLDKYLNYSNDTIFKNQFHSLIKVIKSCLFRKNYEQRPGIKQLLDCITEIVIDKNIVLNDVNIQMFEKSIDKYEIFHNIFKSKLYHFDFKKNIIDKDNEQGDEQDENPDITFVPSRYEANFDEVKQIGNGRFGNVFEVKDKLSGERFAIKKIQNQWTDKSLREKDVILDLEIKSHNFIVEYINVWTEYVYILNKLKQFVFIQMEYCSHNLRYFIEINSEKKYDSLNYYISNEIFREITECVNYLHSLSPPIIHRDIKPENILISDGNNGRFLKLCDFGEATKHDRSSHTRMVGTDKYMAPEVLHSKIYNTKSDIYCLALVATEIFRFEENVRKIRKQKDLTKCSPIYSKSYLNEKFNPLLNTLSKCLRDSKSRPETIQILDSINESTISLKSIETVEIDPFLQSIDKYEILVKFFKTKLAKNLKEF